MRLVSALLIATFTCLAHAAPCTAPLPVDLSTLQAEIGSRQVTFVASDLAGRCWATDTTRANERHTPWSTFKIPHTLIALDSRAVSGVDEAIEWSPVRYPDQPYWPRDWAQAQTLSSAFERSVPWYFQELVPRVGEPTYARWLRRFRYGNAAVPPNDRSFWLNGTLSVSPNEQVEFLSCILTDGCGVSARAVSILDTIAFEDQRAGLRLYGKTGSGPRRSDDVDGPFEGWFVGYVRDSGHRATAVFALFVTGASFSDISTFRRRFSRLLLKQLGLWPKG